VLFAEEAFFVVAALLAALAAVSFFSVPMLAMAKAAKMERAATIGRARGTASPGGAGDRP
jgi:hypothetical protein